MVSMCHGSSSWHLSKGLLQHVHRWEMRWLRKILHMRPRPEDGPFEFRRRSKHKICELMQQSGCQHAHHLILRTVFRGAWREASLIHDSRPVLRLARGLRTHLDWETIKSFGRASRVKEGGEQRSAGTFKFWEEPFLQCFGEHWRQNLDTCPDFQSWKAFEKDFIAKVCVKWDLPPPADGGSQHHWEPDRPNPTQLSTFADLPPPPYTEEASGWHAPCGVIFVVDCKSVADIANGTAALEGTELQPEFAEIADILAKLAVKAYLPHLPWQGYVVWKPRELNARADGFCNLALDLGRSVSQEHQVEGITRWIVHSDGGRRSFADCALGFTIEGVTRHGPTMKADFAFKIPGEHSSFAMEVRALLAAAKYIFELVGA